MFDGGYGSITTGKTSASPRPPPADLLQRMDRCPGQLQLLELRALEPLLLALALAPLGGELLVPFCIVMNKNVQRTPP